MALIKNLGNVVGMIKSVTAPTKTYVLWAKILDPAFPDVVDIHKYNDTSGVWESINLGYNTIDYFTPTTGQTVFALSATADLIAPPLLFVSDGLQERTLHYTIVGTVLTWLDVGFTLDANTRVTCIYRSN